MYGRERTRVVNAGNVKIGGGNPILVQSMTKTDTRDVDATAAQINRLEAAGCELVRVAVLDNSAALAIRGIKERISIPLSADVHFDYRLAVAAVENGADALRINPGNIGGAENVKAVVKAAKERGVPIRVGVNSGSLEKGILAKYGGVTPQGIVESALNEVKLLEDLGFGDIVISVKSSDTRECIEAYTLLSQKTDYPLHVGVTEAGTLYAGSIKSAVGIGAILSRGIGDTVRVSLTADPVEEVKCAKEILKSLGLRDFGVEMISCPTCGRTGIDLMELTAKVERLIHKVTKPLKIAVMGCAVNGPGEARRADLGIAAGDGCGVVFAKGEVICRVQENELLRVFEKELLKLV
jgi:(E)-4-hydroxy-3-methylbut-2-enyl-diphosphate synthase